MLPFAIDGFNTPASMVKIDEFVAGEALSIGQGRQKPTGVKARKLIANEATDEFAR